MGDITELLQQARSGDDAARDRLFDRVYAELRRIAHGKLSRESPLTLIDPTSLVQEAYLRLTNQTQLPGSDRRAFFAYAANVMRSVIITYVRNRGAQKRGGDEIRVTLTASIAAAPEQSVDLEALDTAMQSLREVDERAHQIVEMRYFAGMSVEEIADVLELSPATVKRDWQKARAFLFKVMQG